MTDSSQHNDHSSLDSLVAAINGPFKPLCEYRQFIVYILTPSKSRSGKMDKLPIDYSNGKVVSAHDPKIWLSAAEAIAKAKELGAGVGFVLTDVDPFFFLDMDDCLEGSSWSELATKLCHALAGAACEISSSGRGLHVIGAGLAPQHRCRNAEYKLEFYTTDRFVALTGMGAAGNAGFDCSSVLPELIDAYFAISTEKSRNSLMGWTTEPVPEWNGNTDDRELLERAMNSRSARSVFGSGASFSDLFEGNEASLAKFFPSPSGDVYDRSVADAALAQHLAFWTGSNCERILQLMNMSALKREKWEREDYLPETIQNACSMQKEFLGSKIGNNNKTRIATKLIPALEWINVSIPDIFTNPPKPLLFWIADLLPAGLLTFFAGHGGSGKSMLALQAAVCLALGLPFIGKAVRQSRVVFFSGEDSEQVIRLRLAKICRYMNVDPSAVAANLTIIDATKNSVLYAENMNRQTTTTAGYDELGNRSKIFHADVVIIDNASDTFGANENIRVQVREYLSALAKFGVAVLLLAHVDKQTAKGEGSSEGYSGTTQWHNSARSRWYLSSDGLLLKFQHKKSNHGRLSADIYLTWSPDGILIDSPPVNAQATLNIVLSLIEKHAARNNFISTAPTSPMNPFKVLRVDPAFPPSIRSNAELTKLLCQAEDAGLLIRKFIPAKKRGENREIFMLAPTVSTGPELEGAVIT